MSIAIVVADLPPAKSVRVIGGAEGIVVLDVDGATIACARDTGEVVAGPSAWTPVAPVSETDVDGVRLAVGAGVVRRGRAVALPLEAGAKAVVVPGIGALAIEKGETSLGGAALVPVVVGRAGKLGVLETLPVWVINDATSYDLDESISWDLVVEPTARVVAIVTLRRASWLTFEAVAQLVATDEDCEVDVVVARAPRRALAELDMFELTRDFWHRDAPGDVAASLVTPEVATRLKRMRELDVCADLDEDTIELLAVTLSANHKLGGSPPVIAGTIVAAHLKGTDRGDIVFGPSAPVQAAGRTDLRSFATQLEDFVFVTLSPDTRAAIEKEELLYLDPPAPPLPSADPSALATTIAALAGIDAGALETLADGDHVELRLTLDAANAVLEALPFRF